MNWTEESLNELIRRAQQGSLKAFEEIVLRHQHKLRNWVAAHSPPGVEADDVSQNAFIQAYANIEDFAPGTNFEAWLFTIARYQLMTEATRVRRIADYHSRFAPELLCRELERQAQADPKETDQQLVFLRECLERMGEKGRQFLRWRYHDEIPLQEMADRTGRSLPAVKKQLFVLRERLRDCVMEKLSMNPEGAP
jgi:RNA polymerase sigma-70 factor (ECF subfamily)